MWISNEYTKLLSEKYKDLLPIGFDYKAYIELNPDLIIAQIDSKQKAIEHYLLFGRKENRIFKYTKIIKSKKIRDYEFWNNGKNLLYFSPLAPDYDMSGGGNRLYRILEILKKDMNYNIWFLCNGYSKLDHIEILKKMNIPVFMPDINNNRYLDYYLQKAKLDNIIFDNVIFSWYDIANQYMEIVKKIYPNIKTIVDSVDIHWIRERRGYEQNILKISEEALIQRKNIELNIYNNADVILTVTENDKKHIQYELGYRNNIKILSTINDKQNIDLGQDIIFIGNYAHGPNEDCAHRCINIYNSFIKESTYANLIYKPKLLIAGPNCTSSLKQKIGAYKNIEYIGYIKNLNEIYKQGKILLAPLSWGAGIKSKICDSAMCGIPILTSDIGNEGINLIDKENALIANTDKEFIDKLNYFFSMNHFDQIKLGKLGQEHLERIVSKDSAINILKHTLQDKLITISIVTHNQTKKFIKCLDGILNKTYYKNYNIVITDNSTNNDTQKVIQSYIKKFPDKISYIKNKKNKFFIEPNNAIMSARKYKNNDIILINDDLEIIDNYWLNYLYSSVYSADYISCAGGKTIYPDGRLAEAGAEIYNTGYGKNKGRYSDPDIDEYNIPHYTGYCSGCLLYIRRDAINKIGIFSTELINMYYEDCEWQYRAHIKGLKTIYEPRCVAIHDEGSSSGIDITKGTKKYQEVNRKKFLSIINKLGYSNIEIFN